MVGVLNGVNSTNEMALDSPLGAALSDVASTEQIDLNHSHPPQRNKEIIELKHDANYVSHMIDDLLQTKKKNMAMASARSKHR